ncbi:MAG: LysR family transcriptional regulator [Lachnospiraceae bacterium]
MKLNQLYYFKIVCKYNNITKAAEYLHVSQPAITHAIRELEKELGICLLIRTNKNVFPTQEGELFLQKSSEILSNLEALTDEMRDLGEFHRTVIRVGVPAAIGTVILPQLEITASRKLGIELEVVEMTSEEAEFALYNDELDLIVLLIEDKFYPQLEYKVLKESSLHLLTNKNNPLAPKKSISIPELQNERIILFYPGKIIEDIFKEYHITPKYVLHSNQIQTIRRYICAGLASTLQFPEAFMRDTDIQRIPVLPSYRLDIAIGKKRGKRLPTAASRLYHYLAEHPEEILL